MENDRLELQPESLQSLAKTFHELVLLVQILTMFQFIHPALAPSKLVLLSDCMTFLISKYMFVPQQEGSMG